MPFLAARKPRPSSAAPGAASWIETRNKEGQVETTYTTKPGDAIFVNLHDEKDTYCPGNADNTRWQFDDFLTKGYEVTAGSIEGGAVKVKSTASAKILPEAVTEDLCSQGRLGPGPASVPLQGRHAETGRERPLSPASTNPHLMPPGKSWGRNRRWPPHHLRESHDEFIQHCQAARLRHCHRRGNAWEHP